jgi:hypothetical protein
MQWREKYRSGRKFLAHAFLRLVTIPPELSRLQIYTGHLMLLVLSRVGVTYKAGFGLDIFDLIHSQLGTTGNYSAIADLHTLQFTVTHVPGFSDFTSRILATDLSQSVSSNHT